MRLSLAGGSLLLFGLSVLFLAALTLFESALISTSASVERMMTVLLLILPAGAGAVLGVMSLMRKEGKAGLGILGTIVNTLFALFHLILVLFAG